MGIWEDLCWGEVEDEYAEQLRYYNTSPDKWNIEGGEDFFHLQSRIISALLRIASENEGKTVAVVTHGGAIRALLSHILGIELLHRQNSILRQIPPFPSDKHETRVKSPWSL